MKIGSKIGIYWQFIRPFTLLPPLLGMISGALTGIGARAVVHGNGFFQEMGWADAMFIGIGALMASALNAASNVLNQLTDYENDRINKPERPLPAGTVTRTETIWFFLLLYALALGFAWLIAPNGTHECFIVVLLGAAFTYIYSGPPFRTKRWGLAANVTIAIPRGCLLKVAGWSCVAPVFSDHEPWYIGSVFMLFLIGAATTKDYSDMEGDKAAGCITLPIKYGVRKSAWMISPFFVLPWVLLPIGVATGFLSGQAHLLVALGVVLVAYGAYVCYLLLKDPDSLVEGGENHPSWTHMYRMMMVAQIGFAVAYMFV